MDRKSIILLVASVVLIFSWQPILTHFYPPVPATNTVASATNQIGHTNKATSATSVHTVPEKVSAIDTNTPEQTLTITNADAIYTFTSRGGGLKLVQLQHYPATTLPASETNIWNYKYATLNTDASVAALSLLGGETLQGDGIFELAPIDNGIRAVKTLPNGLTIVKEFTIGTSYRVMAKARIENHSTQNVLLPPQEWVIGTSTPMSSHDKTDSVGFMYYNGEKPEDTKVAWFRSGGGFGCSSPTYKDLYEYNGKVAWADVHNQFFTMATVPDEPAEKLISRTIDLPNTKQIVAAGGVVTNGLQTSIVYPHTNLVAGQAVEKRFTIYAGPKEYKTLSRIAAEMKNEVDLVMNFRVPGPMSLFGLSTFFAKTLLLSMNAVHALFGGAISYGWVIILITLVIKLLFWPLTAASTKSAKRMQAYQPQLKALQEKYKDDPTKASRKQMEFFKEHKINPMGGCLPMLIQIPVFIGFYTMIRCAIELRGVHFLWAYDLTQPDTIGHIAGFPINILPLIYGCTLLYQARITPVSPTMDASQQQMMKYMPMMFLFFLYNMSSGLTLYWTVQNSLTILQTKLTKATDTTTAPDGKTQVQIIPPKKKK